VDFATTGETMSMMTQYRGRASQSRLPTLQRHAERRVKE
jgi:hypothetical protein